MPECNFRTMPGPLVCIARDPGVGLGDIAATPGITQRSLFGIVMTAVSSRGPGSGTKVTAGEPAQPAYTAGRPGWRGSRVVPWTVSRRRNLGAAGQLPVAAACRRSASEMAQAALMSPMWLKAWGKLPSSSPVAGSTSSASRPTSLR